MRARSSLVTFPTKIFLRRTNSLTASVKIDVDVSRSFGSSSRSWLFKASNVERHFSTSSVSCKAKRKKWGGVGIIFNLTELGGWGGCVAQRKHSCSPPSSPRVQISAPLRFYLFTDWFVDSIEIKPI